MSMRRRSAPPCGAQNYAVVRQNYEEGGEFARQDWVERESELEHAAAPGDVESQHTAVTPKKRRLHSMMALARLLIPVQPVGPSAGSPRPLLHATAASGLAAGQAVGGPSFAPGWQARAVQRCRALLG